MINSDNIVIGIYVHNEPEQLQATLNSIMGHTAAPFELVLLVDGPTASMQSALQTYSKIKHIVSLKQHGAAACLNSLCAYIDAPLYAFIESGTLPGPDWLVKLRVALDADPDHGLAGPSTNLCWNEQEQKTPYASDVNSAAEYIKDKHETTWQTLKPLYSLASFCYLVKKEVITAIGAANEAYGTGPGWEMDFNIRAARAGYFGVWVKGAYAYRMALTPKRLNMELQGLQHARQLYQDSFCSMRLKEPAQPYADHCLGDNCPHFATADQIVVTLASKRIQTNKLHVPDVEELPLVSCIMPTRGRPRWVAQAIEHFLKQDYTHKELIIVYDHDDDILSRRDDPRIRYLLSTKGNTIGAKRQQGTAAALGSIIAQWDDDDWYASTRLSRQVLPIRLGIADITGLTNTLFFDLNQWRFWQCSRTLYAQLFHQQVAGGTLVYRKDLWSEANGYKQISLREDAEFLIMVLRCGARLCHIEGRALFIYLRHGDNSWRFTEGRYLAPHEWKETEEPSYFHAERSAYLEFATNLPAPKQKTSRNKLAGKRTDGNTTLVSCIMPTADRRDFVSRAINLFLEQDYPNKELIIIDDGDDTVADLIPDDPRIYYIRNPQRQSTGAKRNQACRSAHGEIIIHWDDDDWMSPRWLSLQVNTLLSQQGDICGLANVFFYEPHSRQAWQYRYDGQRPWVCGGTLCYKRAYWESNQFPDISIGEDNAFVWSNTPKNLVSHNGIEHYIATVHEKNTSTKNTADRRWTPYSSDLIEQILVAHGETVPHYHAEQSALP